MEKYIQDIKKFFLGDIETSDNFLKNYSRDASIFEVIPQMVLFPKNSNDIQELVRYVLEQKKSGIDMHLTVRAAGTCMSGGSLNTSIIIDTTRYMNRIIKVSRESAIIEPGVFYRDLEVETLKQGVVMPAYTASKHLCAAGGMFGNNCAGEKTLKYGKMENYVLESKVIFSDGNEYVVKPLTETELMLKIKQDNFEGQLYKEVWNLITANTKKINEAKPNVSKNSAGYYIWNVWDQDKKVFDLNKLLVGSQGTLGFVTEMTWKLVPIEKKSAMLVTFLPDLKELGDLVNVCKTVSPSSIESFDDYSLTFAAKFATDFIGQLGLWNAFKLGIRFIPEALMMLYTGLPKLILMTEVTGDNEEVLIEKLKVLKSTIKDQFGYTSRISKEKDSQKYWKIRRESFNLLRKHVKGLHTAPCIDDVVVPVSVLPEFLPQITAILDREGFIYTVAGHAGDGNFHIIPLMDFSNPETRKVIEKISYEVYNLVVRMGGSITAEHNDGLIRTMFLPLQYSPDIISIFKHIKEFFDPEYIFNPNKKVIHSPDIKPFDYLIKK